MRLEGDLHLSCVLARERQYIPAIHTQGTKDTKPIMEILTPAIYQPNSTLKSSRKPWPVGHIHYTEVLIKIGAFSLTAGPCVQMQL